MNHFTYYRFPRVDPKPHIPFHHEPTTTRGDLAVFWVCVAGFILMFVGMI